VLADMVKAGIKPDIVILNTLVYGFTQLMRWKNAKHVFKVMIQMEEWMRPCKIWENLLWLRFYWWYAWQKSRTNNSL